MGNPHKGARDLIIRYNELKEKYKELELANKELIEQLHIVDVNCLMPTDDHIGVVARKIALKYWYANEYEYDKVVEACIECAKFVRKPIEAINSIVNNVKTMKI
jgi:predicted transcriptional regulator